MSAFLARHRLGPLDVRHMFPPSHRSSAAHEHPDADTWHKRLRLEIAEALDCSFDAAFNRVVHPKICSALEYKLGCLLKADPPPLVRVAGADAEAEGRFVRWAPWARAWAESGWDGDERTPRGVAGAEAEVERPPPPIIEPRTQPEPRPPPRVQARPHTQSQTQGRPQARPQPQPRPQAPARPQGQPQTRPQPLPPLRAPPQPQPRQEDYGDVGDNGGDGALSVDGSSDGDTDGSTDGGTDGDGGDGGEGGDLRRVNETRPSPKAQAHPLPPRGLRHSRHAGPASSSAVRTGYPPPGNTQGEEAPDQPAPRQGIIGNAFARLPWARSNPAATPGDKEGTGNALAHVPPVAPPKSKKKGGRKTMPEYPPVPRHRIIPLPDPAETNVPRPPPQPPQHHQPPQSQPQPRPLHHLQDPPTTVQVQGRHLNPHHLYTLPLRTRPEPQPPNPAPAPRLRAPHTILIDSIASASTHLATLDRCRRILEASLTSLLVESTRRHDPELGEEVDRVQAALEEVEKRARGVVAVREEFEGELREEWGRIAQGGGRGGGRGLDKGVAEGLAMGFQVGVGRLDLLERTLWNFRLGDND
ncbi:hypothetical protein QBC33DRAFT_316855 [Phialemonium atrogriseum]|uniref:Uncharacterized protein n=1 Tax=Phialemonium atrogriseum TaxID=1093897 RepID=A0AAJ0FFZ9_9PEZI|nr:uncharacterized protein QBC33DRAFT_316855 [Phialemonium atrogriseum]KAK1761893.1 hypothetical protein QBC33DRAFT_316855 [Phialemonium atrogriseum]